MIRPVVNKLMTEMKGIAGMMIRPVLTPYYSGGVVSGTREWSGSRDSDLGR